VSKHTRDLTPLSAIAAPVKPLRPSTRKILDAAVEIRENLEDPELAFMVKQLVQCTLPHKDPGNVPLWIRQNGTARLVIDPYKDRRTGKPQYPYGIIPRLLLFWIVSESKKTGNPHLVLGNSLADFMHSLGLNPRGGGKRSDTKRLMNQMRRLVAAGISFENNSVTALRMFISKSDAFWFDDHPHQSSLWDSWILLSEPFFEAVMSSSVPVDMRVLRAIKRSPLALDLYALLTYTVWQANRTERVRHIPWAGLHAQMGSEYTDLRDFKKKVKGALRKISPFLPGVKILTKGELIIFPGRTSIAPA
jgi:hypothetical protein